MAGVYWIGQDGNYYVKAPGIGDPDVNGGVQNMGSSLAPLGIATMNSLTQIADPNPGGATLGATTLAGGGGAAAGNAATVGSLRSEIAGKGGEIDQAYAGLFGDLDTLLRSRDTELETQYGGQLKDAGDQYVTALPQIESSYAAIGAADSTDTADAKTGAKKGFDKTTETIGKNKETDKAKLGQYGNEQRAKFQVDKDTAQRNVARAGETDDPDALRQMRNDIESNLGSAQVTKATLGTDEGARGAVSALTADGGRYEAAIGALDSILKSSMSGAVKQAAVQAITDSAGLSEEEKKKVQQTYGNVYAEQAAL